MAARDAGAFRTIVNQMTSGAIQLGPARIKHTVYEPWQAPFCSCYSPAESMPLSDRGVRILADLMAFSNCSKLIVYCC